MRKLLVLLLLGTGLWWGYWFVGSTAVRNGVEQALADAASRGVIVQTPDVSVSGFPNRFDLTVEGVDFLDPATGTGWQAPFFQVFAMTWKPWHIIAVMPPEQVVILPDEAVTVASQGLRASARARPSTDLPLAMAVVESGALSIRSDRGWNLEAGRSVLSLGAAAGGGNAYDLSLDIAALAPDPGFLLQLAPDGSLPPELEVIRLRATATLTAPLDRHAGATRPRIAAVDLTDALIGWGALSASAKGSIAPDDQGLAAGRIDFTVTNWRRIMPILVASGSVRPELAPTVEKMLESLAELSGDAEVLELPLVLEKGWMTLGPLPLGPAPVLMPQTG
jgi:hypothetical protein